MSTEMPMLPPALQRYSLNGATMGTLYSAVFFAPPGLDEQAVNTGLFNAVDRVDQQMSTWKADSDLCRLNASPVGQWQAVPRELFQVLHTALLVSRESGGAFDIGVGDLVSAWGFGPAKQLDEQRANALRMQQRKPASEVLEIDPSTARVRKVEPVALDLSGIAKGFGVDELACCLERFGVTRYLVGIDGEMRARGLKPDGQAWAVAIEKPLRGVREVMGVMELTNAAIATSGDYRHWVEVANTHYAHTMDPARQMPLSGELAAVSVVESRCMLADAWATALMVLGVEAGSKLAQRRGMDALFVLRDGEGFKELSIVGGQVQTQC
ncbi:FAD:protein FMN transferase [Pseudomonas boanensis]|uniref:FAD:protein FMN transferase n=1 Tax=Metapseudomonas boanensis TaxID=2822138 RepID=UPI0035D49007